MTLSHDKLKIPVQNKLLVLSVLSKFVVSIENCTYSESLNSSFGENTPTYKSIIETTLSRYT